MYNWSVDEEQFKKNYPEDYKIWRLEQMINFGEPGEKLDEKMVRRYWPKIKDNLDPYKRRFLEFLLWQKLYSLPDKLNFWNWSTKTNK
jgi:hypothetical protein